MGLKGAFLTITNKCNLSCNYCYQNSSPEIDTSKYLTRQEWMKIINVLDDLGVKKITFTGGEPFISPDFRDILKHCSKRKFSIRIDTNSSLMKEDDFVFAKNNDITLAFNLNSHNKKIHDHYKMEGSWDKVVNAILKAKKYNIPIEINSILTKRNIITIDNFVDFCRRLGVVRLRLVPILLSGRAKTMNNEMPSTKSIVRLRKKISSYKGIEVTLGCRTCEAGKYFITLQPNGTITPCTFMTKNIGKIDLSSPKRSILDALKKYSSVKNVPC